MPAFNEFPEEALIISRLLAGYGELEYGLTRCLDSVLADTAIGIKTIFRVRSEQSRIDIADAILHPAYVNIGLKNEYEATRAALHCCRKIRNQFAHCHWLSHKDAGLFFTNLEAAAKKRGNANLSIRHISVSILQEQEEHFVHTDSNLTYLAQEFQFRAGQLKSHPFHFQKQRPEPPFCTAPGAHKPLPFLQAEQQGDL